MLFVFYRWKQLVGGANCNHKCLLDDRLTTFKNIFVRWEANNIKKYSCQMADWQKIFELDGGLNQIKIYNVFEGAIVKMLNE